MNCEKNTYEARLLMAGLMAILATVSPRKALCSQTTTPSRVARRDAPGLSPARYHFAPG